jgi:hypothetical protein
MSNRRSGVALALGAVAALAAGCAADAPAPRLRAELATTTTITDATGAAPTDSLPASRSGPNAPAVANFTAPPSAPCTAGPGATVPVPVSYAVTGAMTVTFTVDMQQVVGQPPHSGTYEVPVPCDGNAHTIVLFAVATDTSTTTQSKVVMTGA